MSVAALPPRSLGARRVAVNARLGLFLAMPCVAIASLVGLGFVSGIPEFYAFSAAGAAVVALIAYRLEFGVLFLPVVAVLVPISLGTGTGSPVVLALAMAVALIGMWIARMLSRGDLRIQRSSVNLPLLALLVIAVISSINTWVMLDPLITIWPTFPAVQAGGLAMFLASAGTLWLVANAFPSVAWLRRLVWIYLAMGAVTLLAYLVMAPKDLPGAEVGGLFSLWVVALAWGQALFNVRLSWTARAALALLAIAWLARRFFLENDWVSGWLPACLAFFIITLLRSWRLCAGLMVIVALLVAVDFSQFARFYYTQTAGSESEGNSERLDVWSTNLELTKDHLLLGTGVAGYALYYMTYNPDNARSSHSNYLDIFAETGVAGSICFLWFWASVWRVARVARQRWRQGFEAGYANAVLGALVGILVAMGLGDWVIPFVYNQTIAGFRFTVHSWVFLGGLVGLEGMVRRGAR